MVIKEGIFKSGNLSIMAISDKIIMISSSEDLDDFQKRGLKEVVANAFDRPIDSIGVGVIFVQGELSYQALSECQPLIKLIDDRVDSMFGLLADKLSVAFPEFASQVEDKIT